MTIITSSQMFSAKFVELMQLPDLFFISAHGCSTSLHFEAAHSICAVKCIPGANEYLADVRDKVRKRCLT